MSFSHVSKTKRNETKLSELEAINSLRPKWQLIKSLTSPINDKVFCTVKLLMFVSNFASHLGIFIQFEWALVWTEVIKDIATIKFD